MVRVKCPAMGGRIIIRGNEVVNDGRISSLYSGQNVGMMTIDCPHTTTTVTIEGNSFSNIGSIGGR
jgi:hypothetical protein